MRVKQPHMLLLLLLLVERRGRRGRTGLAKMRKKYLLSLLLSEGRTDIWSG